LFASFDGGRIGCGEKFPPQLGQTPPSLLFTQSWQNVHSKEHIKASVGASFLFRSPVTETWRLPQLA
jgi:hypothetical protein